MHVSCSRLLCAVTVILLLAACSSSPRPVAPPTVSTQAVLSTLPADGANAVSVDSDISITFSEPVKRASFKLGADLFPGRYDLDNNPTSFTSLEFTALCDGKKGAQWQVTNPNDAPISFTWTADKSSDAGAGVVPAQSSVTFTSGQRKTLRLYVNGEEQASASPSQDSCAERLYDHAYSDGGTTATLLPKAPLAEDQWYTVVLSTRVRTEENARVFDEPYVFSFVTEGGQGDESGAQSEEVQAYLRGLIELSADDYEEILQLLRQRRESDPGVSREELDRLVYEAIIERSTQDVSDGSLSTQQLPNVPYELFKTGFCDRSKIIGFNVGDLNPQECRVIWQVASPLASGQFPNGPLKPHYSFPFDMFLVKRHVENPDNIETYIPTTTILPGFRDAFRHAWWMSSSSHVFGEDLAERFGLAHECRDPEAIDPADECFEEEFVSRLSDFKDENRNPANLSEGSADYLAALRYFELSSDMDVNNNAWGLEALEDCRPGLMPLTRALDAIAECIKEKILFSDGKDQLEVMADEDELDADVINQPGVVCGDIYRDGKGADTVCLIPFKDHPKFRELLEQNLTKILIDDRYFTIFALGHGDPHPQDDRANGVCGMTNLRVEVGGFADIEYSELEAGDILVEGGGDYFGSCRGYKGRESPWYFEVEAWLEAQLPYVVELYEASLDSTYKLEHVYFDSFIFATKVSCLAAPSKASGELECVELGPR